MSDSEPEPSPRVSSLPMWILSGASLIASCCTSVLTAMNSTSLMPASIIRLIAFRPAPPTPTTRMTARYAAVSGAGARLSRGPCSGRSWWTVPPSGSSGGASCSAGSRSGAASVFRACSCAASVALNSSASGPSRRLARFRAIEHLLREVAVGLRGTAGRVVLEDGGALHGRLCEADRLADARVEDELAEVLLEDLDRLARVQRATVEHGRQDPDDLHLRVQVLADHRKRVLELHE